MAPWSWWRGPAPAREPRRTLARGQGLCSCCCTNVPWGRGGSPGVAATHTHLGGAGQQRRADPAADPLVEHDSALEKVGRAKGHEAPAGGFRRRHN